VISGDYNSGMRLYHVDGTLDVLICARALANQEVAMLAQ
jgi:hypothetical protein